MSSTQSINPDTTVAGTMGPGIENSSIQNKTQQNPNSPGFNNKRTSGQNNPLPKTDNLHHPEAAAVGGAWLCGEQTSEIKDKHVDKEGIKHNADDKEGSKHNADDKEGSKHNADSSSQKELSTKDKIVRKMGAVTEKVMEVLAPLTEKLEPMREQYDTGMKEGKHNIKDKKKAEEEEAAQKEKEETKKQKEPIHEERYKEIITVTSTDQQHGMSSPQVTSTTYTTTEYTTPAGTSSAFSKTNNDIIQPNPAQAVVPGTYSIPSTTAPHYTTESSPPSRDIHSEQPTHKNIGDLIPNPSNDSSHSESKPRVVPPSRDNHSEQPTQHKAYGDLIPNPSNDSEQSSQHKAYGDLIPNPSNDSEQSSQHKKFGDLIPNPSN